MTNRQTAYAEPRSEFFITGDLLRRPAKPNDHRREKLAIHDLADRMLEQPEGVLPRFVELAMDVTSGESAGLSLSDPTRPGRMRWRHLRGALAGLEDVTFPVDSPCGRAMLSARPQLSCHPERHFEWIADACITLPEVLHIPLHLDHDEPVGVLWVASGSEGHFDREDARSVGELASFVSIAMRMARSESMLREALEAQENIASEMSHRVKNVLTVIGALVRMSAKDATDPQEMADMIRNRLLALSKAQGLVQTSQSATAQGEGSDLASLLRVVTAPYDRHAQGERSRFELNGPLVACGPRGLSNMALVFHELATNATKYGALNGEGGRVVVDWSVSGDDLTVTWAEAGSLRSVREPVGAGFGSKLLDNLIVRIMGGTMAKRWNVGGLSFSFTTSLSALEL